MKELLTMAKECIERSKDILTRECVPQEYEQQRDRCYEMISAMKTIMEKYEDNMRNLRKSKRGIDTAIDEAKGEQRPYGGAKEDLDMYAKRLNNAFWDAKRNLQNFNLK